MASYSISVSGKTVTFDITGLGVGEIIYFFVRYEPAPADGSMLVDADHNGGGPYTATGDRFTQSFSVLSPGRSYTVNVQVGDVRLGAQTFTVKESVRPTDWSWVGILYAGCPYENLTAEAWNRFEDRIDEFRLYKGLTAYGFTRAVRGMTLLVTLFSEAEMAISGIPGHGTVPTGREMAMTYFNGLAAALNAVT